ncbi:MAG: hypothetical protein NZ551_09475 [Microscillaceae bacterium]|nr:hypothetical protein [Microscillaceae bacterium]MDW8461431.1 hypothetical protein [Cytophagales bacterium]
MAKVRLLQGSLRYHASLTLRNEPTSGSPSASLTQKDRFVNPLSRKIVKNF